MHLRPMTEAEIPAVADLEVKVWGDGAARKDQIEARMIANPEGAIVAIHDNIIVGYAASQRIATVGQRCWDAVTDRGYITETHVPNGAFAFGVGMSALPQAARLGVSGAIISYYQHHYIEKCGCEALTLGSRLPGLNRWLNLNPQKTVEDYLALRRSGFSIDPELRLYEKAGFALLWPVKGYFKDPDSRDWGALIAKTRWQIIAADQQREAA